MANFGKLARLPLAKSRDLKRQWAMMINTTYQLLSKLTELGMGRALDRSCRRLPACANSGIRSLMDPRRCFCLDPFFGDRCEKVCDQGRRVKGMAKRM